MESNNYEGFIVDTVEHFLPRFSYRHICMAMTIRMDWHDHGYDETGNNKVREDTNFHKEVLLVFHRPSNYTKVLFKDITEERVFLGHNKEMEMEQLSDHDSCWRSDGMRWVFQTFVEAWDYFEKHGLEGRNVDPMFGYGLSGYPAFFRIKLEQKDPSDRWNSPYMVTLGRKIPIHEISKYMYDPDHQSKLYDLEEVEKLVDNFPLL